MAALAVGDRSDDQLETRELRFGSELDANQVEAVLTGITALPRGSRLTFDCVSDQFGVRHFVHGSRHAVAMLSSRLRGVVPTIRIETTSEHEEFTPTSTARINGSHRHMLLSESNAVQSIAALLAALTEPLSDGERMLLRVVVYATRSPRLPADGVTPLLRRHRLPKRHTARVQAKYDGPVLATQTLVAVQSKSARRADMHVRRVVQALRACQGEFGQLHARRTSSRAARLSHRDLIPRRQVLSPGELTSIIGWPIGAPNLMGLKLGIGPMLPAPRNLPSHGRQFALSTATQSADRPIAQPIAGSLQHSVIVGPTGSGKSTLLSSLIRQDIHEGRGCFVLDMKGDLVEDLLSQIPPHRQRDVVLLDPSSDHDQPGLRLFPPGETDIDLSADVMLSTLQELFADSWGVRSSQFFRLGLVTLGTYARGKLTDLPRLFHDRTFRARVLSGVGDRYVLAAWQRFESLSTAEQLQQLSSPMTKLEQLVGRRSLRSILGQSNPKLHFGEVLARRRIAPFLAYIDEIAALGALPLPLDGLLERARGLGVGLTLSPQALSQLSKTVQAAVLANVGTFATFRQSGSQEAKTAAAALPGVSAEQLAHLGRFEIAIRMSLGPGATSPVMTGRCLPLPPGVSDASAIREVAASNWGGKADDDALSEERPVAADADQRASNRRRRTS
ncbi:MAG: type IV secretion system DNA-binding domain-containing protein [Solirubrobacterales bacterium]|nr:type IV secretion system DNA-binding domain-containing protein [Solirubrobacterales bacterium]